MKSRGYKYQSEFARKHYGEGKREGRREGKLEGKLEGEREGRLEGRREERVTVVLTVLEARGLAIPPAAYERILGCKDLDELARWVRRAAVVTDVNELFDELTAAQPREARPRR